MDAREEIRKRSLIGYVLQPQIESDGVHFWDVEIRNNAPQADGQFWESSKQDANVYCHHFPALQSGTAFLDNAGGSQLPRQVIDAVTSYLTRSYVQTGAGYAESVAASDNVRRAHELVKVFVGAARDASEAVVGRGPGEVVLGASSTALCHLIANGYADARQAERACGAQTCDGGHPLERDEIIVGRFGHEANIWPWERLKERGFVVTFWDAQPDAKGVWRPELGTLRQLLTPRTRLVAFAQVSNILGEVYDAGAITRLCHAFGARTFVDGVAYAPHRAPAVAAWECDWYVYSTYKVFGPHMAAVYGRRDAWDELTGPNHPFIPRAEMPRKWEPGGANHEGCAAVNGLWAYLCAVVGERASAALDRGVIEQAFAGFAAIEDELQERVLSWLASRPGLRVLGPALGDGADRVCIVSFVVQGKRSADIVAHANAKGLGIKGGHFYSRRLCEMMGLDAEDGVVRISLAHYNTHAELDRLERVLSEVM